MTDRYTEPQWARSALLTIDVQRDFVRPNKWLMVDGATGPIEVMERLAQAFRSARLPIVHVVRFYLPDGSNVDTCRRAMIEDGARLAVPDTEGALVVPELLPSPEVRFDGAALLRGEFLSVGQNEWVMYKSRWSAFFHTGLAEHLSKLGVTTIVVCGLNFPNCPRSTMYEATALDFRVVAVKDGISGAYERGFQELEGIGVSVATAGECVQMVKAAGE